MTAVRLRFGRGGDEQPYGFESSLAAENERHFVARLPS